MAMYQTDPDPYRPPTGESGGDYTPQPYQPPAVMPSQTPEASSPYQAPVAPEQGASSVWNPQLRSPYQMDQNFQYQTGGAANTPLGQYGNTLEGFEASKLSDPNKTSAKYMFGRVASRYAPTQQGFAQLVQDPEFQRLGMQSIGNGKIRLPNGDVIDVVRGFQSGGQAWQWGAETENGQPTGFGGPAQTPQTPWSSFTNAWQDQQNQWQQYQQQQYQQQMAAWQQYQQQLRAWQAFQQQPQQAPQQVWEQPSTPAPYTPQYGGWGPENLPSGTPIDYAGANYNSGIGVQQQTGYAPMPQVLNYLAQGMPSPYYYG